MFIIPRSLFIYVVREVNASDLFKFTDKFCAFSPYTHESSFKFWKKMIILFKLTMYHIKLTLIALYPPRLANRIDTIKSKNTDNYIFFFKSMRGLKNNL